MKIVVLGGSGFIGRNLSHHLAELGHEVYSIARSPSRIRRQNIHYVNCNYDNIYQLGDIYQKADFIFHLASDTTPSTSALQPSIEVTANLMPTLRFIEYLEHYCKATLIYASSGGTIYGLDSSTPHTELDQMRPISYYAASKGAIELFLHAYHRQTGNSVYIVRPANIYGPGQLAKQQFGIIPTLFECALQSLSFQLWGDGTAIRDYLYIDDFIDFCAKLICKKNHSKNVNTYNVGSGVGYSVNDLIEAVGRITGKTIKIEKHATRRIDVQSVALDCSRAIVDLNWLPQFELERGVELSWRWYCANQ